MSATMPITVIHGPGPSADRPIFSRRPRALPSGQNCRAKASFTTILLGPFEVRSCAVKTRPATTRAPMAVK